MEYRRCGHSGLLLPAISLGLWHNFGASAVFGQARRLIWEAFDRGITHFDLANNYGPPPGSAEETLGHILRNGLQRHRDEILITTKAGHAMWNGPYGDWGSRKHLIASCDQSLRRLGVDYVDIFYSHRPDPETPLEETMQALDYIVRSGRALYVGLSKYPPDTARNAMEILKQLGTPCVVHQLRYSMLVREPEQELFPLFETVGCGVVSFSPLAQGQLSERYLEGIPNNSRAARNGFLKSADVQANLPKIKKLHRLALQRGESLSQMAIAWQLRRPVPVTSVIVGVSSSEQLQQNLGALESPAFTPEELQQIDAILQS
ncbi:MAG TPA: aldo/keto reductase [Candidatus Rikenella faecigallinarum]|uniref:Aldo/keto reductase n=1 Tax=Candidatus Rikenella faecigallinarum TaxID=2838745 RepID=A0A9D1QEP3_9BACT|nr:aldo/keto reductase [Candidatus Rikenella faecigallinarum]